MTETSTDVDAGFLAAVQAGLSESPKTLPCRYFYDLEGSLLFDQICELPEYYLTRAEDEILSASSGEIVAALPGPVDLAELGSGTARKTRRLLDALLRRQRTLRYIPVDISEEMLRQTAEALSREFPRLAVEPVVAEYSAGMVQVRERRSGPMLALFLGSNLGNFTPAEAVAFLREMRGMLAGGDYALLGLDLQKEPSILNAAYNDSQAVTARFNLNLLRRINRELGADFNLEGFEHHAFYNEEEGRIEMHLVSRREQSVHIGGRTYRFEAGETIHTENSYKFNPAQIERMAGEAGFRLCRAWRDAGGLFSLSLLTVTG
jgi:L-histidine Nalpha-methyltransferase